jgi:hypothetical protein
LRSPPICRRPLPRGAVHRFYGRRQQRKLTAREPELNSPPSIVRRNLKFFF